MYCKKIYKSIDAQNVASTISSFLKRMSLYKETEAVVKLAVESAGNTKFFKKQVEKVGAEVTVVNTVKFKVIMNL